MPHTTDPRTSAERLAAVYAAETGTTTLNKTQAAEFLGVSLDHFDRHIDRQLPVVRSSRRRIYPVVDLYEWTIRNTETVAAA